MSLSKSQRRNKIKLSIRKKINGSDVRPRVSLYKSNKSIYSQIIDDMPPINIRDLLSFKTDNKKIYVKSKNALYVRPRVAI